MQCFSSKNLDSFSSQNVAAFYTRVEILGPFRYGTGWAVVRWQIVKITSGDALTRVPVCLSHRSLACSMLSVSGDDRRKMRAGDERHQPRVGYGREKRDLSFFFTIPHLSPTRFFDRPHSDREPGTS